MKRTALLGALLIAVIAVSMAISTPTPAHAFKCCDNAYYATSRYWEMGANCSEAESNFRAASMAEANAICGSEWVCNVQTPGCYYDSMKGAWIVDGELYFGCTYDCIPEV